MDAQEEDRSERIIDRLGYPVVISEDVVGALSRWFSTTEKRRVVVLADANAPVAQRAHALCARLSGIDAPVLVPLGEKRKHLSTVTDVYDLLARKGVSRDTLILGIGGGVASDLFGFAAATYMRGIPYAHVATSLVAMVDAAIGGKTGVNLSHGKNLVGTFTDPQAVFCDLLALETLPYRHLREGLAEVVKAAIIEGGEFFELLEELAPFSFVDWPWLRIVEAAVDLKSMIVCDDRLEHGDRELLNLGHTFGHALERASDYRITHGAGVALGLRAAGLLALRTGRFSKAEHFRVLALLALLGMPLRTTVPAQDIAEAMVLDKKKRAGILRFVLPRAIGEVDFGVRVSHKHLLATLTQLGREPEQPSSR